MDQSKENSISQQIDKICDEFEESRQEGNSVRIEDYLSQIAPEHQEQLFEELFEIEAEMQLAVATKEERKNSQFITQFSKDYHDRFPQYGEKIHTIVQRISKQRQIGDYEIISKLGHGGMGVVYKARQKHLNHIAAIKVLPQSLLHHHMAVERFRREMQLIGQLNHPNIVRALYAGEQDGTQYLVMEYIDGINMQHAGEIGDAVPLGAACEIIRQAALGLQHAHESGLVHRDIKPANIMLDFFGTVKVLDLGLGKFHAGRNDDVQALTKTGTTMGTADYISPEQCENAEKVDIRADIYSLGCTFYHIATGHAPYSDSQYDSVRKKLNAHVEAEIPLLSEELDNVPPELDKIFAKMLAKAPEDRFQTPLELAEAIEPFADIDALLNYVDTWKKKFGIVMQESSSKMHVRRLDKRSTSRSNATIRTAIQTKARSKRSASLPDRAKDWKRIIFLGILFPLLIALLLPVFGWMRGFWGPPETPQSRELREQARINLAQLPGLNGGWWFSEIPWFIPPARYLLIEQLSEGKDLQTFLDDAPEKYRDPNCAAVYDWLWKILYENKKKKGSTDSQLPDSQWALIETLKALAESDVDDQKSKDAIQEALLRFVSNEKAVEQHTRAILEHQLAILEDSTELAQTAMKSYHAASKLYQEEIRAVQEKELSRGNMAKKENLELLFLLALADSARLQYLATGDYGDTFRIFEEIRNSSVRKSPLFQAEMFATYGALCAESGKYNDQLFQLALDYVQPSVMDERTHPLAGHIHERYAWSLIDQWKVGESQKQFSRALRVRETNYYESKNPYALIYVLHNKHGIALSDRYLGKATLANQAFEETIKEIDEAIVKATNGTGTATSNTKSSNNRQYLLSLRDRAANTRERYADCTLYGGVASSTSQGRLGDAARLYGEAAEFYESASNKRVMRTKQAMILILQGDESLIRGEEILKELDSQKGVQLGRLIRMKRIRQLADAVLALSQNVEKKTPEQGRVLLRRFLQEMDPLNHDDESSIVESLRRENLEMQLFGAERLLKSYLDQLNSPQNDDENSEENKKMLLATIQEANQDLSLITAPFSSLQGNQELRPFLRRFVHQLITFFVQSYEHTKDPAELHKIVRCLLPMRAPLGKPITQPDRDTSYVFFYLTNREDEGFILFSPQLDRLKQSRLFHLPLTRAIVRQQTTLPSLDSEQFHLSELFKLVEQEKQAGRTVVRSWNDTACYSSGGLRDPEDWPKQWGDFP